LAGKQPFPPNQGEKKKGDVPPGLLRPYEAEKRAKENDIFNQEIKIRLTIQYESSVPTAMGSVPQHHQ
jgi:hypothetical protein